MRVAVVGLGIVGAGVARSLALAGADVTVFERAAPAAGTTATSFAWINSHQKEPLAYHELNVAGMAEHRALAGQQPWPTWLMATGNLEWAADETANARLHESVERLRARDYPVAWISHRQARRLAADLRLPLTDIAYYPAESHVFPVPLLGRLWGEARDHGATLRCPARVIEVSERPGGVLVRLDSGDRDEFDSVVLCAGRWSEALTDLVPLTTTERAGSAAVGLLGYTCPVPARLTCVLTTPRLNVRPDGGGRLVLQAPDLDQETDPSGPPAGELGRELGTRLSEILAGTDGVRLESLRVGKRPLPADGHTVAGFLRAGGGAGGRVYVIVTHSGITLGPLLGRLAAEEITTDVSSDLLAGFRPDRFAAARS